MTESVAAAPGDLNRSFGQNGVVKLPFDSSVYDTASDVAAGPDGELYVLRNRSICGFPCPAVERIRPDGSVDLGFGAGGAVGISVGGPGTFGGSLAVAPDGKILVAALGRVGYLTRLNPEGTVDAGFGNRGSIELGRAAPEGSGDPSRVLGAQVAVGTDGKPILAVDQGTPDGSSVLVLSRYLENGAPDSGFAGGGAVSTVLGRGRAGIALFDDGELAVADAPSGLITVQRLFPSGVPDTAFGDSGVARVDRGLSINVLAVLARPDGGIDVVAVREYFERGSFALRFRPNGTLDRRFGRNGIRSLNAAFAGVEDALVDRRGRLTLVGDGKAKRGNHALAGALTLLRLRADGHVDRTFAGGAPTHLLRLRRASVAATTLGGNGRITILTQTGACVRSCSPFRAQLTQYMGGSSSVRCFGRRATIVGTRAREVLKGTPGPDVIAALAGDDTVRSGAGRDLICGGAGNDYLGRAGSDRIRQ